LFVVSWLAACSSPLLVPGLQADWAALLPYAG